MEAGLSSLFLLIALKHFQADSITKTVIAAAANTGMIFSTGVLRIVERTRRPVMHSAAAISFIGAAGFVAAAMIGGLTSYTIGVLIGLSSFNLVIPLVTTVYQRNYEPRERGRNVSSALMVRFTVSALIGWFVGHWLDSHLDSFKFVLLAGAVAQFASGCIFLRIESDPLGASSNRSLRHAFALMGIDRTLRSTMVSWMFMGIANLVTIPLRTEYLGNPRYGIDAKPSRVALLVVAIPAVSRVLMAPVFGRAFDRLDFFATRIVVNGAFALSILAFFTGTSTAGLVAGSILFGVAAAGGDVLWNLWATKLAPADQVADYMSLHTFFTGVRGLLAPVLAFWLVANVPLFGVGITAAVLIFIGSLILVPEMRDARASKRLAYHSETASINP